MRVGHAVALLLVIWLCAVFYTRGLVAGVELTGHGDIVGWTWWAWMAPFTIIVALSCADLIRRAK